MFKQTVTGDYGSVCFLGSETIPANTECFEMARGDRSVLVCAVCAAWSEEMSEREQQEHQVTEDDDTDASSWNDYGALMGVIDAYDAMKDRKHRCSSCDDLITWQEGIYLGSNNLIHPACLDAQIEANRKKARDAEAVKV